MKHKQRMLVWLVAYQESCVPQPVCAAPQPMWPTDLRRVPKVTAALTAQEIPGAPGNFSKVQIWSLNPDLLIRTLALSGGGVYLENDS